MAEPLPPARVLDVYPLVPDYEDHGRVLVLCSCGGLTDLSYSLARVPRSVACDGCGAELELGEVPGHG